METNTATTISTRKPPSQSATSGQTNISALGFELDNSYAGNQLEELTFTVQQVKTNITPNAITVWHDVNADGSIDAQDAQLSDGRFVLSGSNIVVSISELFIIPPEISRYIVTVDL